MGKERTPAEGNGKGGPSRPVDAFGGGFVPMRDTGAGTALFRRCRAFPVPPPPLPPSRCTVGFVVPTPSRTWRATTFPEVLLHSPPPPAAAVAVPGSPPFGLGWQRGAADPAWLRPAVPMPAVQQVRGAGCGVRVPPGRCRARCGPWDAGSVVSPGCWGCVPGAVLFHPALLVLPPLFQGEQVPRTPNTLLCQVHPAPPRSAHPLVLGGGRQRGARTVGEGAFSGVSQPLF